MKQIVLSIFAFTFLALPLCAQNRPVEPVQTNLDIMRQEGQLVTVKISPGSPLKIFVVGREEASLDLSKMKLTVRRLAPGTAKTLSLTKSEGYFTVSDPIENDAKLEVTTKVQGKTETFNFKMSPAKP